jgi:hypothetical protein
MFCKLKTGEAIVSTNPPLPGGAVGSAPDPFLKKQKKKIAEKHFQFRFKDKYSFQTVKKKAIMFAAIT